MQIYELTQKNYTMNGFGYQLKLPFNIDCIIPEDDSVRLLSQSVEEMDLTELYMTYSRVKENQPTPMQMLKIMMYANMNQMYSSRPIERACKRDINFMFLLEGKQAPDHATIARFRSIHFAPIAKEMLAKQVGFLKEIGEISAQQIFIDGTKIESVANKYTFVWKKSVTKNQVKLMEKIPAFVQECEEMFGIQLIYQNEIELHHLKKLRKKLYKIKSDEGIEFVHGIGKRKTPLQKSVETLEEWLERLKKYAKNLHVLGERNSYSKTDQDATFMRMKEDAMLNGQLKPGYNVQVGVDSEYVVWLTVGSQPTDTTTLIPFLKEMETYLGFKYEKIVADAGYESEENYLFLERNGQLSYIKPANYEISKTQKYKKDIGRLENMTYFKDGDYYVCRNNKNLVVTGIRKAKSKTGHESIKTCYSCEDCNGCPHKSQCIRGNNCKTSLEERTKNLEVSKIFMQKRQEDLERILTDEGCELRMNRSIQAEGAFGCIKHNMQFRRFLCRGKQNVMAECALVAMAQNINKLHNKIQKNRYNKSYLHKMKKAS